MLLQALCQVLMIHMIHGKSAVEEFQYHLAQEDNGECKTEVDQYLSEASEPPCALGFDILGWWRVNSSKYKILSYVAWDVMAIPMSRGGHGSGGSGFGVISYPNRLSQVCKDRIRWPSIKLVRSGGSMIWLVGRLRSDFLFYTISDHQRSNTTTKNHPTHKRNKSSTRNK